MNFEERLSLRTFPVVLLAVFLGLVMMLAGIPGFWITATVELQPYMDMQSWVEVPAQVLKAEVRSNGLGAELEVLYMYEFKGKYYTASKVGPGTGLIGAASDRKYHEVLARARDNKPFRCYVDPDSPSSAVLFKDFGTGSFLFGLATAFFMGGAGFVLFAGGATVFTNEWRTLRRRKKYVREPWLQRRDWARGNIRSHAKRLPYTLSGLLVFSCVIVAFVAVRMGQLWPTLDYSRRLNVVGFTFLAASLLAAMLLRLARIRKHGVSILRLHRLTGVVGGTLHGKVTITRLVEAPKGVNVVLRCEKIARTGPFSSNRQEFTATTIFEDEYVAMIAEGTGNRKTAETTIPIEFEIPADAPESKYEGPVHYSWLLSLFAESPGVDYAASFEVPVFLPRTARLAASVSDGSDLS